MKKYLALLLAIIVSATVLYAQDAPPQAFSFQSIIYNAKDKPVCNSYIKLRFSILENNAYGTTEYQETHTVKTSNTGLAAVQIGHGTPLVGVFEDIPWGDDKWFLFVEVDPKGGNNFVDMSRTQLLSVPYALYSGEAALASAATHAQSADFATNAGHASTASTADYANNAGHSATADNATNAEYAAVAGSAGSFDETDPFFTPSPAAGISEGDITDWNKAHSWGDHAAEGYLTIEGDDDPNNEIQDLEKAGDMLRITNHPLPTNIDLSPYTPLTEPQVEGYVANNVGANYLAKSYNGTRFTNSSIYDAGYNVGIGTSSPSNRLHVWGNIRAEYSMYADNFRLNQPITKTLIIPAFEGNYRKQFSSSLNEKGYDFMTLSSPSESNTAYFHIPLPDGAKMKDISFCISNNTGTFNWRLFRTTGPSFFLIKDGSDAGTGNERWTTPTTIDVSVSSIYTYILAVYYTGATTYCYINGIKVKYEIDDL